MSLKKEDSTSNNTNSLEDAAARYSTSRRYEQHAHQGRHISETRFSRSGTGQVRIRNTDTEHYSASMDNPYLESGGANERFSKIGTGFVSAGGMGTTQARIKRKPHHLRNLLALLLFAVLVSGAYIAITRFMPISVNVNGQRRSYTRGITLGEIFADEKLNFLPGNFVSVSGEILSEGEGNPYTAFVNDEQIPFEEIASYVVAGKDEVRFADGDDIMEDYDVEIKVTQPKLVMDGEWGAIAYIQSYGKVDKREIRTGRTSGEVAEGEILEEGSNCVIRVTNITPSDGRKLVALTFDDGPSGYTQAYLDILDKYGARATFFMLGSSIDDMPEVAKMVADRGHQVATHTYSHQQLTAVPAETVRSEVSSGLTSIQNTVGLETTVMRPPYGDFRQTTWHETEGMISVSVLWNMDSLDWSLPGVDQIVSNSIAGISSGSIILMHDGGGNRDQDLQALPKIIEDLQQQGYTFVTINELLASDDSIPKEVATGNQRMPADAIWPEEIG